MVTRCKTQDMMTATVFVFGCGCVIRWDKGLFVLLCVCCLACLRGVYIAAFQVTRRPVCNNWCFPNPPPLLRPPLTAVNLFYPRYTFLSISPWSSQNQLSISFSPSLTGSSMHTCLQLSPSLFPSLSVIWAFSSVRVDRRSPQDRCESHHSLKTVVFTPLACVSYLYSSSRVTIATPTPTAYPHPFSHSNHLTPGTRLLFF